MNVAGESNDTKNKKRKDKRHIISKAEESENGPKKTVRSDWNQTDSEVTVILFVGQGIDASQVDLSSTDEKCHVKLTNGREWSCKMYSKIVCEGTKKIHKGNRVILKLVKKVPGEHWPQLDFCENEKEVEEVKEPFKELAELTTVHHNHYEKSTNDVISVFVYVKNITRETINVKFEDDLFFLQFQTSDAKFLNEHQNCSPNTVFSWKINLKHKILARNCSYKLSPVRLELMLKKSDCIKWGGLEKMDVPKGEALPQNKWVPASKQDEENVPFVDSNKQDEEQKSNEKSSKKPTCMVLPLNKTKNANQVCSPGLIGLDNLGNTCFMNSVIQCFANTREFRDYFLNSDFQSDINCDNPLGMGGKLALSFAVLLRVLWSGTQRSYAPSKLKTLISMKASQFTGFAQHDAQEFMAFLLDGLHEDLNRVKSKPYVESVECEGKDNKQIAEECWNRYKLRNDSVVVDLFQGQYKSKLVCPVCNKVSITFDPFLYLTVPLPKKQLVVSIIFFWRDPFKKPIKYIFNLASDATVEDLREKLYEKTDVKPYNQRIFEVYKSKIHKVFSKENLLSSINPHDIIFCFEKLDEMATGEPVVEIAITQRMLIPKSVNQCSFCRKESGPNGSKRLKRCTKCYRVGYCDQVCQKNHWSAHKPNCKATPEVVGQPFIVTVPESQATFKNLCSWMSSYSRHSVDIFQPPVSSLSSAVSKSDCSSSTTTPDQVDKTDFSQCDDQEVPETVVSSDTSNNSLEAQPSVNHGCSLTESDTNNHSFFIKPVDKFASSLPADRLNDHGETPLDLSTNYFFGMDWKNNPKAKNYVLVQSKDINYEDSDSHIEIKDFTLDNCLELFTEPEILSPQEAWYCSSCKKHREASKELSLWRLPTILIIQLKRFSFKNLIWRDKLDKMVNFPLRGLDITPYYCGPLNQGSTNYDLYAVINHHGGILGGHYTAFGRCIDLNNSRCNEVDWRLFDDSTVTLTSENQVITKGAYVLFYRRRGAQFNLPSPNNDRQLSVKPSQKNSDDDNTAVKPQTSQRLDSNIQAERYMDVVD